jgi:hypothetical protein
MSHTSAAPSLFSYVQAGHFQTMMRFDHFRASTFARKVAAGEGV